MTDLREIKPAELTERAKEFLEAARGIVETGVVEGYVIMAFNKDFERCIEYHTGFILPSSVLPSYVQGLLTEYITLANLRINGDLDGEDAT